MDYKDLLYSLLTALPNQYLMLPFYWRIKSLRINRNKSNFFNVLHPFGTETYMFFKMQKEDYSNTAHLSAVLAAVQYSETLVQNQDDFSSDFEASDEDDEYSLLQNPTKAPIILKDFLRALPHCPIIHWASQMKNNPRLCFCPCSILSHPWREKEYLYS
jgi:hypothetical protein